ncbi:Retrovirus-related Pol poly from transposon 412 [Paramuricea clavata]|uniref:Retrovirus-related Pol poly from transposon 412 n=1 Tax=Paramuricea clavata TaxID=317549 RepID=A0A7D9DM20_PARCT|nr:Retrovirus-related Pol poly from transposon 412 [Paramuricea clavata]
MLFATWLAQTRNLALSSVSSYIAAVRSWHIDLGAPDPTRGATRLARLLRGIRRCRSSPALSRLPVINRLMGVLQSALSAPGFDHVMFWAACSTAFFGFLRVSEFTCAGVYVPSCHLSLSDIQWDAAGHYRLFLKSSKTDPFHKGCTVLIGPSGHQICPVAALSRYLAIRGSFPGPLFLCVTGAPLSPSLVNAWLRFILKAAGVPGNYSSDSFRIGAATSAALAGVPDHVIKILGRWSSDCYLRYIRTPPHIILQTARHIV